MKAKIHPKYGKRVFKCVCGNVIETRSTIDQDITVEICSACHPFFTGKQKLVDSAGRVERFRKKYEKTGKTEKAEKDGKEKASATSSKG